MAPKVSDDDDDDEEEEREEEESDDDNDDEEESSEEEEDDEEVSEYAYDDEEEEEEEEEESSDDGDRGIAADEGLCDKVVSLLERRKSLDVLKLDECKAYLRKHELRLSGTKAICIERINEHWRIKDGNAEKLYPRSSFVINCTGDACTGDVILFKQRVYEKFDIVTRSSDVIGKRIIAGRVVKESYGTAKQQHTFTVEILWCKGFKQLPPLFPLLVKGRNLYRLKTFRQPWTNEAERAKVLAEKHRRGAAARLVRANAKARSSKKELDRKQQRNSSHRNFPPCKKQRKDAQQSTTAMKKQQNHHHKEVQQSTATMEKQHNQHRKEIQQSTTTTKKKQNNHHCKPPTRTYTKAKHTAKTRYRGSSSRHWEEDHHWRNRIHTQRHFPLNSHNPYPNRMEPHLMSNLAATQASRVPHYNIGHCQIPYNMLHNQVSGRSQYTGYLNMCYTSQFDPRSTAHGWRQPEFDREPPLPQEMQFHRW